jgi:hypothetical protein
MADAAWWGWGFIAAGIPLLISGALFVRAPETGPGRS